MSTRIAHRCLAALASTGAAAALALVPASGAHAAVQASYLAGGNAFAEFTGSGGGTCDLTSGDDAVSTTPVAFGHGTKRRSADLKATFTNSLDSSDKVTVKGHVDSALTLRRSHKDLRMFDLTAGGSVKITHTVTGSDCHGEGLVGAATQAMQFTEHKKGWLTITRTTKNPSSVSELLLVNVKSGQAVTLDLSQGTASQSTSKALLTPGTYEMETMEVAIVAGGSGIVSKTGQESVRAKQTVDLHGVFKPLKKKHH